jgi:hypothetical protein
MNSWISLGLVLGLLFIGSVMLNYELYANGYVYANNYYTPLDPSQSSLSVYATNSTNDLNLSMTLSNLTISPGQAISLVIDEANMLNMTNNVNASGNWLLYLARGPCGPLNDPMGVAFFKGYYTASNILGAESLGIYKPGTYSCPAIFDVNSYGFQPLSDNATIFVESGLAQHGTMIWSSKPLATWPMNADITVSGYWTDNPLDYMGTSAVFHNFEPGIYTVVGGDEWGQLLILHFEVT